MSDGVSKTQGTGIPYGSLEHFEAGKHRQEVLLVGKIVAASLPVPTDEEEAPARKRAIRCALFLEDFARIRTGANQRDFPLKFVRIDDHSFEAIAGTKRC